MKYELSKDDFQNRLKKDIRKFYKQYFQRIF